jgi:hypothetical protein
MEPQTCGVFFSPFFFSDAGFPAVLEAFSGLGFVLLMCRYTSPIFLASFSVTRLHQLGGNWLAGKK